MSDYITIKYKINKTDKKIKIFSPQFFWKNNDKAKIIYNNKEYNLIF